MKKVLLLVLTAVLCAPMTYAQKQGNVASALSNMLTSEKTANEFLTAVKNGKVSKVKQMIDNATITKTLVNVKDDNGNTPMMWAAKKGFIDIVKLLGNAGARVNTTNKDNWTALCFAASNNRPQVAEYLLKLNAKVDFACGKNAETPLLLSAANGANPTMIRIFVNHTANVNATDADQETPLMKVASTKQIDSARTLIKAGAKVNANTEKGMSPAMKAVFAVNLPMVKFLIENGGEANAIMSDGVFVYALDVAQANSSDKMVQYLKSKGYTKPDHPVEY